MNSEGSQRFTEGIRLFNRGKFFEAHEVWEEIWKQAEGEEKIFYQGLIQAAAALVHAQRGNCHGAVSLYLKSRSKLERFPEVWMGIDLEQFRSRFSQYFEKLQTLAPGHRSFRACAAQTSAERPPMIRLA
jgi:uncharacterized protein